MGWKSIVPTEGLIPVILCARAYSHRTRALLLALPLANGSHTHFAAASLVAALVASHGVNDTNKNQYDSSKRSHFRSHSRSRLV